LLSTATKYRILIAPQKNDLMAVSGVEFRGLNELTARNRIPPIARQQPDFYYVNESQARLLRPYESNEEAGAKMLNVAADNNNVMPHDSRLNSSFIEAQLNKVRTVLSDLRE
jgi:hypothetical protein